MLFGAVSGELEIRQVNGETRLHGRFPYNAVSTGAIRGTGQKEQFRPGAFSSRIANRGDNIFLLSHHDIRMPLASKDAGTLTFTDSENALEFNALIGPEIAGTSYGQDTLAQIRSGLVTGISPGFNIIRQKVVDNIRTIEACDLGEISIVTAPIYGDATVEARAVGIRSAKWRRLLL